MTDLSRRTPRWTTLLAFLVVLAGAASVSPPVAAAATDGAPPTAVSPVVRFRPLVNAGENAWVSITAVGHDAGSGMAGTTEWAVSRNGGALKRFTPTSSTVTYRDVFEGVPHTAAVVIYRTLAFDGTYRFASRMFDRAGHASRWAYGPTISPRLIQEAASNITYSAGWTQVTDSFWYGRGANETGAAGGTATIKVSARAIAWVARQGADKGQAEVWIDGTYATTIDLHRLDLHSRTVVFTKTWSATAIHTVTVKVLGSAGHPFVDVDAFLVIR